MILLTKVVKTHCSCGPLFEIIQNLWAVVGWKLSQNAKTIVQTFFGFHNFASFGQPGGEIVFKKITLNFN